MFLKAKEARSSSLRVVCAYVLVMLGLSSSLAYAATTDTAPTKRYSSGSLEGQIGATDKVPVDNPADNIFHVVINEPLQGNEAVWLVYELDGVQDHTAVSRGINDHLSVGGYLVKKRSGWSGQRERIDASWLKPGDNVIRFTLPEEAKHSYRVRHVGIEVQAPDGSKLRPEQRIVVNHPETMSYYSNQAYVKGFILGATQEQVKVKVDGKVIPVFQGQFETIVQKNTRKGNSRWKAEVEVHFADGMIACREISYSQPLTADFSYQLNNKVGHTRKQFSFKQAESIALAGTALNSETGARQQQSPISITTLREVDIPALDPGMVNVTRYNDGFRYLPHGTTFDKEVNLQVAYDKDKIPAGYTEKDIKTYFFDEKTHHWVPLPLDSVYGEQAVVLSRTNHFTDMINAIMMVPESPEAQAYNSTSMKGIQAANPTAGVNLISPPQANTTGSASMGYPIHVPAGRSGLQPQLAISYNSGGGDSWLGLGWNLNTPSISIDTRWGVPRYDAAKETETYSMNGEQLSPVAHRSEPQNRSSNKQFYPRVEGSFSRIIRHGSNPKNYWWEVTDKSGVKYFYGGTRAGLDSKAVLTDEAGNIAHWALVEVRDLNNNFMRYTYDKVADPGVQGGNVPGYQLYVDKITYTGHGSSEGSYAVSFIRDRDLGEAKRKDISINARYGFKQVTADLLRKIEVHYAGKPVRSYELQYRQGAFYKTLLQSVAEFDAAGKRFTTHTFDYYDDLKAGSSLSPFEKESVAWDAGSDRVEGVFSARDEKFAGKASALGGTRSNNASVGVGVGVGFDAKVWSKSNSITGNVGFDNANSKGIVTFLDINGDGLPDKIFVDTDGNIWFRPNESGASGNYKLGEPRRAFVTGGVKNFYKEKSTTVSGGLQAQFGDKIGGFVAGGYSKTKSTTSVYFSDVNGDQLPDLVSDGKVYFNHLDKKTGHVEFKASSEATPSPIGRSASVAGNLVQTDPNERAEIIAKNPLHDMVRMWEAPYDGQVKVTAPVRLLPPANGAEEPGEDGVKVSIQLKDKVLWEKRIQAKDYATYEAGSVGNLAVRKGDRLYFRLQSIENGYNDAVDWAPVIEYRNKDLTLRDANGKPLYRFAAADDFILSGEQEVGLSYGGRIEIKGSFYKQVTTDALRVEIIRIKGEKESVVWGQDYAATAEARVELSEQLAVDSADVFKFRVVSATNIDWSSLTWKPYLYYTSVTNPEVEVTDEDGKHLLVYHAVPHFKMHTGMLHYADPYVVKNAADLNITPSLRFNPDRLLRAQGSVEFSVKKPGALLHKKTFKIENGVLEAPAPYTYKGAAGDSLFFEYHFADSTLASLLTKTEVKMLVADKEEQVKATSLFLRKDTKFGPLYRGWGHFSYNGNGARADQPINQQDLKFSEAMKDAKASDYEGKKYEDLEKQGGFEPAKENFVMLIPIAKDDTWMGFDNYTLLNGRTMQSSRYGVDEVPPLNGAVIGQGQLAVNKMSESHSTSFSGGISATLGGGFGAGVSGSTSSGPSKVVLDFMDMNGDRYPDVVSPDKIQYSQAHGGLSDKVVAHGQDGSNHQSYMNSNGASLSGSFVLSKAQPNASNTSNPKDGKPQVGSGQASAGISGNYGEGYSRTDFTYADINGDGLPDRLYKSNDPNHLYENGGFVNVALNLGYRFAPAEPWNLSQIQTGSSKSYGGGVGVDIAKGSISAGVSLSFSENKTDFSLQDVNGDGLADLYYLKGDGNQKRVYVRLNTGTGFSNEEIAWSGATTISESRTASQAANAAYTTGFLLPIPATVKIVVNPSVSAGKSVSRDLYGLHDVDGDGFPDFVESSKDNELKVKRSTIGRTNMLKSVQRPLGASFVLNYERLGNTYEMPQAVWALSRVAMFDGYKGDGPDSLLTTFAYEDGYYDRHEREFYGFAKVTTRTHDTGNKNALYANAIQTYQNSNYYEKGLLLKERLEDAEGKSYVEKENIFELRDAETGTKLAANNLPAAARVYPALTETVQKFYEGQPEAGKSTRTRFDYDRYGNVTRIEDYGDEGPADDLFAQVAYHYKSDSYIMSMPRAVEVSGTDKLYRKREAEITDKGQVREIRQYLNQEKAAVYSMEYDAYGNLTKVTRPENAKGQRFSTTYTYDEQVRSFVTKVSNSYGYSSEATYDYRFGQVLTSKDINGNPIHYTLDNLGRVETVKGPYEMKSGAPYTIRFEYHPEAQVPWALTQHYDPAFPKNFMETATFVDGLGRVLQTKKDAAIYQGDGAADKEVMVVSGKVVYDGLGRATHAYYPVTEALGNAGKINVQTDVVKPTISTYDVLGRALTVILPDGAVSKTSYGFGNDFNGAIQFLTTATDANNISTEQYTDARGRVTSVKNAGDVWTSFTYNAMGEQTGATDALGHTTVSEYDQLGRRISRLHPDAGLTNYSYDLVGNLSALQTASMREAGAGAVTYSYDFERLTNITYPQNTENNVRYTYGESGAAHNRAGRIVLQEDASGAQEFFYGQLGEVVKNIRTIVIPQHDEQTFVTEWSYDTWNRLTSMVYPDGEEVTYTYNTGGLLRSMSGKKKGADYKYVQQLGYDKFGQRVFLAYGNGTKTTYSYEADRRRLQNMVAKTAAGRAMMDNVYGYDKVNNILSLKNNAPVLGSSQMGGSSSYSYTYDDLYRLTEASGSYKGSNEEHRYTLNMSYNSVGGILSKVQTHERKGGGGDSWVQQKRTTYEQEYTYGDTQPHAPVLIGRQRYSYDASGNQTGWKDEVSGQRRQIAWDEENRIRAIMDNGAAFHYTYDAAGERVLKGRSSGQAIYVNGQHKAGSGGIGNFTVYVNPYLVLKSGGYTKHFYIEGQRITSKLGSGNGADTKNNKAGGDKVNYPGRQGQVQEGIVRNLKFLGQDGAILTAGKSGKVPPGQLIGGGGNNGGGPNKDKENFLYFFHPDHLGSSSYITDASGEVYQHLEYFAFGETFVEEHSNTNRTPYLFNGKELDEETGLYYYGARYYDPRTSVWQSVDPLAEKYPSLSTYAYVANNPLKYIDPDGKKFVNFDAQGNYQGTTKDNWLHNLFIGSKGRILNDKGETTRTFRFADPKNDVAQIQDGIITKLVVVNEQDIKTLMARAGVFNSENKTANKPISERYNYILKEGQGMGKLDFAFTQIPKMFPGSSENPLDPNQASPLIFLTGDYAHNQSNFGNFLYGAAGYGLGYSKPELLLGAHYNSLFNENGYPSQFDSSDDQLSIKLGIRHAYEKDYRNKQFSVEVGRLAPTTEK
jgi:RHS repeat-associated protein